MTARGGAGPFPERAALEAVLGRADSPQAAVRELLGERRLWWRCCAEAVRSDPGWFAGDRAGELAAWLDATAPGRADAPVPAARQVHLLGRALSAPGGRAAAHDEDLIRLRDGWRLSGLLSADVLPRPGQPSGGRSAGLPPEVNARLDAVRERIALLGPGTGPAGPELTGAGNVLVIAALLMAGAQERERPVVRVPVVFGQSADGGAAAATAGVSGILELVEFPAGPTGLYPDPRATGGTHSTNGQFAAAVGRAWQAAGPGREGRCVLWRIVLSDDPLPPARIEGPSLGAAFAIGLRELLRPLGARRPRLDRLRSVFYGLRPRTAVTGALSDGEGLLKVSGMEAKLLVARRKGLRLVAPEANRPDIAHAPEQGDVRFAETLKQADRYARQFRVGRLLVALLLVLAAGGTGLAVQYRSSEAQSRLEAAHRLAELSQSLVAGDVGLAELFAVRAYQQHADPLTRQALFRAVTASPHLVGGVQASGPVSALAASAAGVAVLAGTQNGVVERWPVDGTTAGRREQVGRIPVPVTAVATDSTGDVVAAIGEDAVGVWRGTAPVAGPVVGPGLQPAAVGVSPSGRFVVVSTTSRSFDVPPTAWVLDRNTGSTDHLDLTDMPGNPDAVAFSDDEHVVLFDGDGYGTWAELTLPGPIRSAGSTLGFGTHDFGSALAPDGSLFTYTNSAPSLPLWPADGTPDIDRPRLTARLPEGRPTALALSRHGIRAAAALGTSLYVARTDTPDQPASDPVELTGAGAVVQHGVAFLDPAGSRLVSAAGDVLTLWDLGRQSRIASETTAAVGSSCNACPEPRLALSPDGRRAAVLSGNGDRLDLRSLDPADPAQPDAQGLSLDSEYGALTWSDDGTRVIVASSDGSALILDPRKGLEPIGSWPPLPDPLQLRDTPVVLRFLPGGREVAQLDSSGTIRIREPATGRVLREVDGPHDMAPTVNGTRPRGQDQAALDRSAGHAAVIEYDVGQQHRTEIRVIDASTGGYRVIDGTEASGVAYAGDQLLVQRKGGDLEVWSTDGAKRSQTLKGTPGTAVGPVVGSGLIAARPADGNVVRLFDRPSGDLLGSLAVPPVDKANSVGLAVSADGSRLVAAVEFRWSKDDTVAGPGRLIGWRLDPSSWIAAACGTAGRELTPALWRQYLGTGVPSDLRCTP
ncbi:WD40 repeat protein [Kitasatospora sp. SolWspMP-SS2h]|uniref:WD40 repeat domain-containing protein n=1 Tax=Kitasatospora sp. SolWspMP-SS2h TaxID=1305729 RepID=UPI000DBA06E7|nr:WD40 repeat domain-containing protein [Kitasatospora sp. SolWspMP-SS2h]RAJ29651.1 WD40 repeat protein [Kitasatospora sp. SolWspMP-SS2h]